VPSRPASPSSDKEKGGNSNGVRKSILKSWKSASGSLKASNGQAGVDMASRSSMEHPPMPPDQQPRSRRGSLAGLGGSGGRTGGSKNSVVLAMADIPPSPRIPDEFVNSHEPLAAARARSSSLLSGMINGGVGAGNSRRRPTHMAARPSISSYPSSQYISDSDGRVSMASSSRSRDSSETRPSFDTSQFEMVTPPRMMTASLSYPVGDDGSNTSMGDQ
jgi:hypothetical protein